MVLFGVTRAEGGAIHPSRIPVATHLTCRVALISHGDRPEEGAHPHPRRPTH
jgi:hypothetical protein